MRRLLLIHALLTGCASGLQVTYQSDPPGATLYEEGRSFGQTPVTLTYAPDKTFLSGGCQRLKGTSVRWVSGASASIGWLSACASVGTSQTYTFQRPAVAGAEIDASYAAQMRIGNAIERQAAARAMMDAARYFNPAPQPLTLQPLPKTTNCRSYWVGDTWRTTCD